MQPSQLRLTEQERADLVAFLDGELDEEEAQRLETKASTSVSARKELEALEKTWNMLDWLPRVEAPEDFTGQTISRIHSQHMRAELIEGKLKQTVTITGKVLAWLAATAASLLLGFVATRYAWPDPTRQLIQDLDIVDNLENYLLIPDIKLLDDLAMARFFSDIGGPTAAEPPAGDAAPAQPAPDQPAADTTPK